MKDINIASRELDLQVFDTRIALGAAAGRDVEKAVAGILKKKGSVRMIFAAAPSQNELLDNLTQSAEIDWDRITAFNMDEYIGLAQNAPQLFSTYLQTHIFNKVSLKKVHLINSSAPVTAEIKRYGALIEEKPIDIVCLGIGENGHIAFNDPPVADFKDTEVLKTVELDAACRMQQVHEGHFPTLANVPATALTLTIPVIMGATYLFCVVPGSSKKEAVFNTLHARISEDCPATILRTHPNCKFYFDKDSHPEPLIKDVHP